MNSTVETDKAIARLPKILTLALGALGLAALHDSYHVGQLAMARRRYGLDRLVG
jgi:hypothetical protein